MMEKRLARPVAARRVGLRRGLAAAAALALAVAGCRSDTASKGTLAITLMKYDNPFFVVLLEAAREEAARRGYDIIEHDAEEDSSKQAAAIDNFITQDVDAILLNPVDSAAIVKAVEAANAAGIPVICIDVKADGGKIATFVASDNRRLGVLTGEYIAKRLAGKGEIALVTYPEVSSGADRAAGLRSVLAAHPEIRVVAEQPSRGDRLRSEQVATNILTAHPELDAIWALNDPSALGCLAAVRRAGRESAVFVVGIDGAPEAIEEIRAGGPFAATAAQYPREIGRTGVAKALEALAGAALPEFLPIQGSLVERENAGAYAGW